MALALPRLYTILLTHAQSYILTYTLLSNHHHLPLRRLQCSNADIKVRTTTDYPQHQYQRGDTALVPVGPSTDTLTLLTHPLSTIRNPTDFFPPSLP